MNVFELEGNITLDTSGYEKAIKDAVSDSKELENSLNESANSMIEVQKELGRLGNELVEAKEEINRLKAELEKSSQAASEAADGTKDLSREFDNAEKAADEMGKEVKELDEEMSDAANSAKDAEKAIDDAANSTEEFGDEAQKAKKKTDEFGDSEDEAKKSTEKLKDETKSLGDVVSNVKDKIGGLAGAIKDGLVTAAKIGTAAVGAASTVLIGLTKSAVSSYGEYEQLVGGVDTLFKESSTRVQKYADEAYKTAGLSANEYMQTVTSFSASLLQGLGGDTEKAADIADLAIRDMSDNANKMGTDMQSIQNAYQGFAKQNYTMLDNLKLGYGGTKTEMERLLADAESLTGIEYNIENYSDVIEAIHAIQTEIGITGTTSAEAANTIEGSTKAMKAAWDNLVVELGKDNGDISGLMDFFIASVENAAKNLIPRIELILSGIGKLIEKLAPVISKSLPKLVKDVLPSLLKSAGTLVSELGKALVEAAPALMDVGISILAAISKGISNDKSGGDSVISNLLKEFNKRLPTVLRYVKKILKSVATSVIQNLPEIIRELFNTAGTIMESIGLGNFTWILDTIQDGVGKVKEFLGKIDFEKIKESVSGLWEHLDPVIQNITDALGWLWDNILEPVSTWALNEALPALFDTLEPVLDTFNGALEIFKPLGKWLWEEFLKPVGEWAGDIAVDGLELLSGALGKLSENLDGVDWSKFDVFGEDEETGKSYWEIGAEEITKFFEEAEGKGNKFVEFWNKAWGKVGEAIANIVIAHKELVDKIKEKIEEIKAKVSDIWQHIKWFWSGVKSTWSEFQENWGIGIDTIRQGIDDVKGWFSSIGDTISETISNAWQWGNDLVQNFIDGITSKFSELEGTLEDFGEKIYDWLHQSTAEVGPLKDTDVWGKDFADNWINGIKSKQKELEDTVRETAGIIAQVNIAPDSQNSSYSYDVKPASIKQTVNLNFPHDLSISSSYDVRQFVTEATELISENLRNMNIIDTRAIGGSSL